MKSHAGAFTDGPTYEATLGPAHGFYVRVKARVLLRLLRRLSPGAKRVADLGCGTGQMEEALAGNGLETVGVDLSEPMIAHANSKSIPGARFQVADAARTSLASGSFDAVFATALFHHVPPADRAAVVREMKRIVRPGGLVVVFEHNPANPITRRMVRKTPVDADAILLPRAELRGLVADQDLHVLGERFLVFFPRMLGWFSRTEPALAWCPAGGQYVIVARRPVETAGERVT